MKRLLVVVDYQNDFVNGSLGFPRAALLEEAICQKIADSRAAGDDVVFTFDTHGEDYLETQEGKNLPVVHCVKGTAGWNLYGKVADCCQEDDQKIEKPVFGSLELALFAAKGNYTQIELCGLVSNICVISNAAILKASLPETVVTVDARCTDCLDPAMNEKALDVMEGLQIQVTNRA